MLPVDYRIIPMEFPVVRQTTAADGPFWSVALTLDLAIVSSCCRLQSSLHRYSLQLSCQCPKPDKAPSIPLCQHEAIVKDTT